MSGKLSRDPKFSVDQFREPPHGHDSAELPTLPGIAMPEEDVNDEVTVTGESVDPDPTPRPGDIRFQPPEELSVTFTISSVAGESPLNSAGNGQGDRKERTVLNQHAPDRLLAPGVYLLPWISFAGLLMVIGYDILEDSPWLGTTLGACLAALCFVAGGIATQWRSVGLGAEDS